MAVRKRFRRGYAFEAVEANDEVTGAVTGSSTSGVVTSPGVSAGRVPCDSYTPANSASRWRFGELVSEALLKTANESTGEVTGEVGKAPGIDEVGESIFEVMNDCKADSRKDGGRICRWSRALWFLNKGRQKAIVHGFSLIE